VSENSHGNVICRTNNRAPRSSFSPGIGVIDPRMISVLSVRASGDFHQSENISESIKLINLKF